MDSSYQTTTDSMAYGSPFPPWNYPGQPNFSSPYYSGQPQSDNPPASLSPTSHDHGSYGFFQPGSRVVSPELLSSSASPTAPPIAPHSEYSSSSNGNCYPQQTSPGGTMSHTSTTFIRARASTVTNPYPITSESVNDLSTRFRSQRMASAPSINLMHSSDSSYYHSPIGQSYGREDSDNAARMPVSMPVSVSIPMSMEPNSYGEEGLYTDRPPSTSNLAPTYGYHGDIGSAAGIGIGVSPGRTLGDGVNTTPTPATIIPAPPHSFGQYSMSLARGNSLNPINTSVLSAALELSSNASSNGGNSVPLTPTSSVPLTPINESGICMDFYSGFGPSGIGPGMSVDPLSVNSLHPNHSNSSLSGRYSINSFDGEDDDEDGDPEEMVQMRRRGVLSGGSSASSGYTTPSNPRSTPAHDQAYHPNTMMLRRGFPPSPSGVTRTEKKRRSIGTSAVAAGASGSNIAGIASAGPMGGLGGALSRSKSNNSIVGTVSSTNASPSLMSSDHGLLIGTGSSTVLPSVNPQVVNPIGQANSPLTMKELSPMIKPQIDEYLLKYLNFLCVNPNAKDRMGHMIHQMYTARRIQRYEQLFGWRPLKFRIEAFVNGFVDLLTGSGFTQDVTMKIPHYLNNSKLFSRFNESGNRMKSQGQTIWRVRARCRQDMASGEAAPAHHNHMEVPASTSSFRQMNATGSETTLGALATGPLLWEFLPYERCIVGQPPLAIVGSAWQWNLKVHDHWTPRKKVSWLVSGASSSDSSPESSSGSGAASSHSSTLPKWLTLQGSKLKGTPLSPGSYPVSIQASFQEDGDPEPIVVTGRFTIQVSKAIGDWKRSSITTGSGVGGMAGGRQGSLDGPGSRMNSDSRMSRSSFNDDNSSMDEYVDDHHLIGATALPASAYPFTAYVH